MEILLLNDNDITKNTILGGNIDVDKYKYCIADAQTAILEEVLGEALYEKIKEDFDADTLTGDYLVLHEKYIVPFLIHASAMEYLKDGAYMVNNGGIYKHSPENGQTVEKNEVDYLVQNQRAKSEIYQQRMEKWLCKKNLPEYKFQSDNIVNPKTNKLSNWRFI
jgi:hypothetical protein